MPSKLDHLITDPAAPVTVDFARKVHEALAKVPSRLRRARRDELASTPAATKPASTRAAPTVGKGEVDHELLEHWTVNVSRLEGSLTASIREAARLFPNIPRADFIATLVALGVNASTAGVQFKKGRDGQ